jgi:hypothetical protein
MTGVTAVDVGCSQLALAVYCEGGSWLEVYAISTMPWRSSRSSSSSSSMSPPRKKSRSSSMDTLCRVEVGEHRVWSVCIVDQRVLYGGNQWTVECVDVSVRTPVPLWKVDVGNAVLSMSMMRGEVIVVTADRMVSLNLETRNIVEVRHSSNQMLGLCLHNASFPGESKDEDRLCGLCGQPYAEGVNANGEVERLVYCCNASGENVRLCQTPRLLGLYSGNVKKVTRAQCGGNEIWPTNPCVCGSDKIYGDCCKKFHHTSSPISSIDCGGDDHAFLASLARGPFLIQHLGHWVLVDGDERLFERFPGWDGKAYDPMAGANILSTKYGMGKVNDAQFWATPLQYGHLRVKTPTNVVSFVVLVLAADGSLVPGSVMFCLQNEVVLQNGESLHLRIEYGDEFRQRVVR